MKKILALILLMNISFCSCKQNDISEKKFNLVNEIIDTVNKKDTTNEIFADRQSQNLDKKQDCNKTLLDFIKSSTLNNPFKDNLTIEIEDSNASNMKIMLYDGSNVVGTLLLDAQNFKLLDLTNDIENPEVLKFDNNKWNSIIDCYFQNNKNYYLKTSQNNSSNDCITEQIEMGSKEACTIKNTTLKNVYSSLIKNKLVDKSEKLKNELPLKSENIKINLDGLISIDYKVTKNKTDITMSFEGGETSILLQQKGNDVQRTIIHSAD